MKNPAGIKAFGLHLRRLRDKRGISQQELADMADISKLTVQRAENAKFSVTLDVLLSLARGLEVSLAELMNFEIPNESDVCL